MQGTILSPTDFVALANQTLEHVFGFCQVEGELANFRISKGKWLYFDIKDEHAKIACFASVYALPGPLEDGMVVRISGTPRLHPQFGFSLTVQTITPAGEGAIKKAFELLKAKLSGEGLFDASRKKPVPYPPRTIALVASVESAAYADFVKVLSARWPFSEVIVYDTLVQGEAAPAQLQQAIISANQAGEPAEVLVVSRGGGSADDLQAFNDERVVRAIAASRIPTLVAIGHEIDESLSELAADKRASTPSNAAELLVPDKAAEQAITAALRSNVTQHMSGYITVCYEQLTFTKTRLMHAVQGYFSTVDDDVKHRRQLLEAYNPNTVLERGYAVLRCGDTAVCDASQLNIGDKVSVLLAKGSIDATVDTVHGKLTS